jgi:hypothetical protein
MLSKKKKMRTNRKRRRKYFLSKQKDQKRKRPPCTSISNKNAWPYMCLYTLTSQLGKQATTVKTLQLGRDSVPRSININIIYMSYTCKNYLIFIIYAKRLPNIYILLIYVLYTESPYTYIFLLIISNILKVWYICMYTCPMRFILVDIIVY